MDIKKTFQNYLKKREDAKQAALNIDPVNMNGLSAAFKALDGFNFSSLPLQAMLERGLQEYKEIFAGKGAVKITQVSDFDILGEFFQAFGKMLELIDASMLGMKNGKLDGSFLGDTLKKNQKELLKAVELFKRKAARL